MLAIVAVNAVGGIHQDFAPGSLILPDQIIDYTYGRKHTFFEDDTESVTHIDFSHPYSEQLTHLLTEAAENANIPIFNFGTYACTQGPRLETAAEIRRLKNDGCDVVGMTAMPEAGLARELEIEYASINIVANWAAGLSEDSISMDEIEKVVGKAIDKVKRIIDQFICLKS